MSLFLSFSDRNSQVLAIAPLPIPNCTTGTGTVVDLLYDVYSNRYQCRSRNYELYVFIMYSVELRCIQYKLDTRSTRTLYSLYVHCLYNTWWIQKLVGLLSEEGTTCIVTIVIWENLA
jgi:hypothetical protein